MRVVNVVVALNNYSIRDGELLALEMGNRTTVKINSWISIDGKDKKK